VHGRMCYRRIANVACFMFFKNIANVCALYFYSFLAGASAMQVMPLFYVTWYNLFFSSAPVLVYGLADQDVPKDVSAEVVELYGKGLRREFFTHPIFMRWCAEGVYFGLLCAYVPVACMCWLGGGDSYADGRPADKTVIGWAIVCNVTVCVNFRFALEQHSWGWIEGAALLMMFLALETFALDLLTIPFLSSAYLGYYDPNDLDAVYESYRHPNFWLGMLLCLLLSLGPRLASKGYHGVVGTPAKNAMLVRRRRRRDMLGVSGRSSEAIGGDASPVGSALRRSTTGTGFAFSENEPSTMHLHATGGAGSVKDLMRSTVPGAAPPPAHQGSNVSQADSLAQSSQGAKVVEKAAEANDDIKTHRAVSL